MKKIGRVVNIASFILIGVSACSDAARDGSHLSFAADSFGNPTKVQLLAADQLGRQTGQNGVAGPQINNIPNSSYIVESVDSDSTGSKGTEVATVGMGPVTVGQFTATVFGTTTTAYELHIDAADTQATLSFSDFQGFVVAGGTREYVVSFDPAVGGKLVATKIVSFDTLRQDIETAFQLSQIGGKKFVDELADILTQGEKALTRKDRGHDSNDRDRENKQEAIAKLKEFIQKLEEAAKIKPEEQKESKEAQEREHEKENRRFVSSTALQSLTSDANTLIQQLGGTHENDNGSRQDQ